MTKIHNAIIIKIARIRSCVRIQEKKIYHWKRTHRERETRNEYLYRLNLAFTYTNTYVQNIYTSQTALKLITIIRFAA